MNQSELCAHVIELSYHSTIITHRDYGGRSLQTHVRRVKTYIYVHVNKKQQRKAIATMISLRMCVFINESSWLIEHRHVVNYEDIRVEGE